MKTALAPCCILALGLGLVQADQIRFKILALAEAGGHHVEFTTAAKPWLAKCGKENGFKIDYITNTAPITEKFLMDYQLVLQLDFVPYGWTPEAMAAFKAYIEEGRGGWVGLHHATLLGKFDGQPIGRGFRTSWGPSNSKATFRSSRPGLFTSKIRHIPA